MASLHATFSQFKPSAAEGLPPKTEGLLKDLGPFLKVWRQNLKDRLGSFSILQASFSLEKDALFRTFRVVLPAIIVYKGPAG